MEITFTSWLVYFSYSSLENESGGVCYRGDRHDGKHGTQGENFGSIGIVALKPDGHHGKRCCGGARGGHQSGICHITVDRHDSQKCEDSQRHQKQLQYAHPTDADVGNYFFQIRLRHGESCNHHGKGSIHVRNIIHGIKNLGRDADLQEKKDGPDACADYDRRKKPFLQTLCGEFAVQQHQPVRPGQDVKYGQVSGQKEHAFTAEHAVDQGNPDKTTVGIGRAKAFHCKFRIAFFRDQEMCDQKPGYMSQYSGGKGGKKTPHQRSVIIRLENSDDETGIYHHQQEAGQIPVPLLVDDVQAVADECENHDKQHFYQLIQNQGKHMVSFL